MKSKVYSEHNILPTLKNITLETVGKPFFIIKEGMKSKDELANGVMKWLYLNQEIHPRIMWLSLKRAMNAR